MATIAPQDRGKSWNVLASELAARMIPPRHPDTLIKARRKGSTRPDTAKELERITGIDRRKFLYPDEFGDPWPELLSDGSGNNRN
jgi:hypothetical protein